MSNYPYDSDTERDEEYDDEYDGESPVYSDSDEAWTQTSWQRGPGESDEDYQDRMEDLGGLMY